MPSNSDIQVVYKAMSLQVTALRAEKQKWQLLTAERDAHRGHAGDLEADVARLKVEFRSICEASVCW